MIIMRRYKTNDVEFEENENVELEISECETDKQSKAHFETTYRLKPNENYEVNNYSYETDRYGRIKRCEGTLRLEEGKRNTAHQIRAGEEYRLENDEGGHLIGARFGGSEKIDNIVPMDYDVNHHEYKDIEDDWAEQLKKNNKVYVKIDCVYEGESTRPTAFIVKYRITEQNGFVRNETKIINNTNPGGDSNV